MRVVRILLCEDEVETGKVAVLLLEQEGYYVDHAETADQAVILYELSNLPGNSPYDLVISDIEMPRHTGLYFSSYIRSVGYKGPLAILTAYPYEAVKDLVRQVDGRYWPKPEAISDLPQRVTLFLAEAVEGGERTG